LHLRLGEQALNLVRRDESPLLWAQLHSDMGLSWLLSPAQDPRRKLEQAAGHYRQAAEVYTPDAHWEAGTTCSTTWQRPLCNTPRLIIPNIVRRALSLSERVPVFASFSPLGLSVAWRVEDGEVEVNLCARFSSS
jgi:hypothetical protein